MKNKSLIIIFITVLLITVILQFISYDLVINMLKGDLSPDGIIKQNTLDYYRDVFGFIKIILLLFPILCLVWIKLYSFFCLIIHNIFKFIYLRFIRIYTKISLKVIYRFSLVIISFFMFWAAYNFDVGLDEAHYLNDVQNMLKSNTIMRNSIGGAHSFSYDIPNLPFNLAAKFFVPLFGFSIFKVRIIIILFSLLFLVSIRKLFTKQIAYLIIPLIFFFPGVFSLTSIIYLETTALAFLIIGLYLFKRFENTKKIKYFVFSALFMSIAMATKLQLILWIGLTLVSLMILEYKKYGMLLFKYLLLVYSFFIIILFLTIFDIGYVDWIILLKTYFFGQDTSGALIVNGSKLFVKAMMLNELIILPLIIFLWVKTFKIIKNKYNYIYMKFIYFSAVIIPVHWVFFFRVFTWRNVFIGLVFNLILFAIYLVHSKKSIKLIILSYILLGIISNYVFVKGGVIDNIQYYRVHILDGSLSLETNKSQKKFFSGISELINNNNTVYVPLQPYFSRIFLNNREIKLLPVKEDLFENDSYLIVTAGDVKEGFIQQEQCKKFISNSELLLKEGDYSLYKLVPNEK